MLDDDIKSKDKKNIDDEKLPNLLTDMLC